MTAAALGATDRVGAARPNDWFTFSLGQAASVDLGLSGIDGGSAPEIVLTDAGGAVLAFDFASASRDGSIVQSLAAGTYWVDVSDGSAAGSKFALSVGLAGLSAGSADEPHATQATARALGAIDGMTATTTISLDAAIGATDDTSFTIAAASLVAVRYAGMAASLGVELLDATGAVVMTTAGSDSSDATIEADLAPGTYTLQASGAGSATNADVSVGASALPVVNGTTRIGDLGVSKTSLGWVGPAQPRATYAFTLSAASSIGVRLSGLSAGVGLAVHDMTGAVVASAIGGPLGDASVTAALAAGNYTATVDAASAGTGFTLSAGLQAGVVIAGGDDGFGHAIGSATSLAALGPATRTITGTVGGASTDDFFSVTLDAPSSLSLDLGGLSQAASLSVDDASGAVKSASSGSSNGNASINSALAAGTYLIDVSAAGASGYGLSLSAVSFGGAGGASAANANALGALNQGVVPQPPPPAPPIPPPPPPTPPITPVSLLLTAGDFAGALDALEAQATRNLIGSISLSDDGAPAFMLSAAQLAGDQDALRFIASPYSVIVADGGYRASQAAVTAAALGPRSGVTSIGFADGTLTFDASTRAASVVRLYQAALGRAPDTLGLNYWVGTNRPLPDLAQAFLGSAEFASRYGAELSDAAFVSLLYRNVLQRAPDAYGDAHWLATLASGVSRAAVLTGFSDSAENVAGTSALIRAGIFTVDPAAPPIARLYDTVLGRAPDVVGLQAWDQRLESGAQTLKQIATGFTGSAEFQSVYGSLDDADFVATLYVHSLHRAPDANGLSAWTMRLASGALDRAGVVLGFSESTEHQANTQASIINADPNRAGLVLA